MVVERDEKGYPSTITTVAEDITDMIDLQDQLREKIRLLESISYKNSHMLRSPVASIIGLINSDRGKGYNEFPQPANTRLPETSNRKAGCSDTRNK